MIIAVTLGIATSAMSLQSGVPAQSSNGAVQQPSTPVQTEKADGPCGPVYDIGGSVRPPVPTHLPDPKFSKEARDARFSGNILVGLIVDSKGKPCNVHLERGVGIAGVNESAVNAVQHYKFKPAMQNGKPIAVNLKIEVNFNYSALRQ